MKNQKEELRKQLDAGIAMFLANGGTIKKGPTHKALGRRSSQPKEQVEVVEIEVDHLPEALQKKFFAE